LYSYNSLCGQYYTEIIRGGVVKNEQEKQKILEIIRKYNEGPSSLVQVLTIIQEEHGYLPMNVQQLVAKEMKVPFSRVFEVTSFYSRFTTEQKGKCAISVCLGTACYVKGAQKILDELKRRLNIEENKTTPDGLYTLSTSRCIGACALAPALTVNKEVHATMNKEKLSEIMEMHK
jgi:NADH-quinone oxidoreductase subunit E/NADP-reducing hydrogenase subunit HndA